MSREDLSRPADLGRLQRWMQAVVVHPGAIGEALQSAPAERELPSSALEHVVRPSASMTASERIGVYHGMYLMRMEEALAADYPVIRYHVGDRQFSDLVREYVGCHPSRSYTLNRLGDHLPRFFLEHPSWPQSHFLHDLARFELAMTEAFDERDTAPLQANAFEDIPEDRFEGARLVPIAAFRLLALRHPVVPHLEAYHKDLPSPRPRRRASWVAVYRRDFSVRRLELSRAQHDLLSSLADGVPLGDALTTAVARQKASRQGAQVFAWFRTWITEGLFTAIEA